MDIKYYYAIKAGIICGAFFAIASIIDTLLYHTYSFSPLGLSIPLSLIYLLLLMLLGILLYLILIGTGYQVVRHSKSFIQTKKEAIILSAIAGGIVGLMAGATNFIVRSLMPDIINYPVRGFSGHEALLLLLSFLQIIPAIIVGVIIVSIGGLICVVKNDRNW